VSTVEIAFKTLLGLLALEPSGFEPAGLQECKKFNIIELPILNLTLNCVCISNLYADMFGCQFLHLLPNSF
jgi:hypothetical protein